MSRKLSILDQELSDITNKISKVEQELKRFEEKLSIIQDEILTALTERNTKKEDMSLELSEEEQQELFRLFETFRLDLDFVDKNNLPTKETRLVRSEEIRRD